MGNIIPYFYADLIARMIPGAMLLAFISLTNLALPQPWKNLLFSIGSAQAVVVPFLFAGLAYALGTVIEALSSILLERIFIHAYAAASKKYTPIYTPRTNINFDDIRSAKCLSRASFSYLITSTSDNEKQAIPHIVRFHSEAKMCFGIIIIFVAFLVIAIIDLIFFHLWKFNHVDFNIEMINKCDISMGLAIMWLVIMIFTIIALSFATYQRLQCRTLFVLRTIDRFGNENKNRSLKILRYELLAFCEKVVKPSWWDLVVLIVTGDRKSLTGDLLVIPKPVVSGKL